MSLDEQTETSPAPERDVADLPVPPHVPKDLVRDLRPEMGLAANHLVEPYAPTEWLNDPSVPRVMWSPFNFFNIAGGHWVVKSFKDCATVYTDNELFSTEGSAQFQAMAGETFASIPMGIDPPDHGRYRRFLNPWFTAKAVAEMAPDIRASCDDMLGEFIAKRGGDFAWDFGRVFPVHVFLKLMGFPLDMFERFLAWEHEILHSHDFERMGVACTQILAWLRGFIAEKVASPDDSLTSKIVNGEIEGERLTPDEQIGIIFFLWLGGLDTVASTLGQVFRRLALDHGLQQRLRDNRQEIKSAVEEFLRVQPLVFSVRKLKRDTETFGVAMKAGDHVMALTSVGNFDPDAFACPRSFDPLRKANRHMTFSSGVHLCLGAHLARQEMVIALEQWLSRVPLFSLAPDDDLEIVPGLMSVRNLKLTW